MKIEIEIIDGTKATMTIDGKKMKIVKKGIGTTMLGIKSPETDETLGGIVASEFFSKICDILRAFEIASEYGAGTWDKLDEEIAEEVAHEAW